MIEYVDRSFNPYTGCLHSLAECPVYAECWARSLSKRFKAVCGGDFKPRFHLDRLEAPLHWHKPQRVAVSFVGDLWGPWPTAEATVPQRMDDVRHNILQVVRQCSQHRFLFLTKAPEQYTEIKFWPSNAWAGITLTGAEPPERQDAMLEALQRVQGAGVRYLSYEPALAPLTVPIPPWLDWIVVGGWSDGRPANELAVFDATSWAIREQKPYWEKNSLAKVLGRPLHQELPHV